MATSFLTLGGWDWNDYSGNITWFDALHSWNQTLTELKLDDASIIQEYDHVNVMFEIGYPFIGLNDRFYGTVSDILERQVSGLECKKGKHWGICRVPNTKCEDINFG